MIRCLDFMPSYKYWAYMYDIVIMGNHSIISMFGCDISPFLTWLCINLEISSFEFLKFWPSHTLYLKINSSSSQLYVYIEGINLSFQPRKLDVHLGHKVFFHQQTFVEYLLWVKVQAKYSGYGAISQSSHYSNCNLIVLLPDLYEYMYKTINVSI